MDFELLGGIQARHDGEPVDIGTPRQRFVLAALLVDAGRLVSQDQVVSRVWGEHAPPSAKATVRSYLSRLRQAGIEIERRQTGYVVCVDPDTVDVHRFRRLTAEAGTAGDVDAVEKFGQALGLWRGEPLAGLDSDWASSVRRGLDQERFRAELDDADLRLRLGRHTELVGPLGARAAVHPLDERLAGQLILALHRSGRSAAALAHYDELRHRLADELGTDPSPTLRALHLKILDGEDTAPGTTPAQLPADVSGFTGREPQLAQLDGLIGGSTIVISAIAGVGGVGKTALAVHWAHQVRHHFPDGQLYVDLRGYASDHPVEPAEALSGFLHALGAEIPHDAGVASARFRSLLADKKMLVLLDNARTADQVRPLLPGTGSSLVLVTSRDSLGGLTVREGAKRLDLDMLTVDDAISLLRTLVGVRVDAEPEAARQLAAHCSRLPLALRLAAELAVSRPAAPLRELVEDLDNEQERLKLLDSAGDAHAAVGAVFSWSYRTLDPVAARVFGLLGHIPGPDIGLDALVSFTGLPAGELRLVLRALEHAHWIEQHRRGRYRMHDVVRLYAAAQITPAEDDVRRVVDHYLRVAHAGDRLLDPLRPPIDLAPLTDQPVPAIDSIGQAMRWFDAEHDCVIGAQHLAVERGWYLQVYQLGWSLTCYHIRRGDWARNLEVTRVSFQAAKLHGDPALELRARRQLGGISGRVGRYEESVEHLRACLAMAEQSGDPTGQLPFIHSNLSTVHEANGRMREALAEGQIALEMFRRANLPDWINELMNIVGWQHAYVGEYDEARALCEQSLARNTALGNEVYIAANLDALGYIAHHVGDHQAAIRYFTDAIETLERTSYLERQARALRRLSEACRAAGKVEEGDEAERRAAELELALKG